MTLFALLSACGGTEASSTLTPAPAARTEVELTVAAVPAPTGTSIPGVTATPRTAPEPRATAASGPATTGFDHARFQREVLNVQPEAIRVSANIPSPTGAGTAKTEYSIRTGDDAVRMVIAVDAEDVRLETELVLLWPRIYLRGQSGNTIVDWIATTNSESANPLADPDSVVRRHSTLRGWTSRGEPSRSSPAARGGAASCSRLRAPPGTGSPSTPGHTRPCGS